MKEGDLHDPAIDLSCGVKRLGCWVQRDKVIASHGQEPAGGGEYESTLRESRNDLPDMVAFSRSLVVCSGG